MSCSCVCSFGDDTNRENKDETVTRRNRGKYDYASALLVQRERGDMVEGSGPQQEERNPS